MQVEYLGPDDAIVKADGEELVATGRGVLVTGLKEGEPVFVLRGQDAIAMGLLNLYRSMTEGLFDGERALALEADVQAFIDWRQTDVGRAALKDPD